MQDNLVPRTLLLGQVWELNVYFLDKKCCKRAWGGQAMEKGTKAIAFVPV